MNIEFKTFLFEKSMGFFSQKMDLDLLQQQLNKYGQSGWRFANSTNVGSQFKPALLIIMQREK